MNSRICSLVLALGFAIPAAYAADPVYKSTMPNGRIVYGESPQPGAKRVEKVTAVPEVTGITVADEAAKNRASLIRQPDGPAVAVIPEPVRPAPKPALQGESFNIERNLPKRSY